MFEPGETASPRILIVEDEALIALDLKMRLIQFGYTVLGHVFSAAKALPLIEQDYPDLVLMDIVTQGPLDGIEAAEIIRSRWGIPIIFTTAYADRERLKRAKLAYPFGYLLKPYQDRDLQVTIEMALYVTRVDKDRRRIENDLKESEEKYRLIADNSGDWIYLLKADQTFQYVSPSSERITGYTAQEFMDHPRLLLEIAHPDDQELVKAHLIKAARESGPDNLEFRIITKTGECRWIRHTCYPVYNDLGEYIGRAGANRDITIRKKTHLELEDSEERYRSLFEMSPSVVVVHIDEEIVLINPAGVALLGGKTEQDILGLNLIDQFFLPEYREAGRERSRLVWKTDRALPLREYRFRRLDDRIIDVEATGKAITFGGKKAVLSIYHDITERKKAEAELQFSKEMFSKAFQASPDWISLSTLAEGRYLDVNNAYLKMTGRTREEVIDKTSLELDLWHNPDDRLKGLEIIREKGSLKDLHVKFRIKSGELRDILWSAEVIEVKGLKCLLSVCRDISGR
jgi:PAS domain S-box-containing protein